MDTLKRSYFYCSKKKKERSYFLDHNARHNSQVIESQEGNAMPFIPNL